MTSEQNPNETLIGPTLRGLREGAELTQRGLAKASEISQSHLSRVEAGKATLSDEFKAKVVKAINDRLHQRGESA